MNNVDLSSLVFFLNVIIFFTTIIIVRKGSLNEKKGWNTFVSYNTPIVWGTTFLCIWDILMILAYCLASKGVLFIKEIITASLMFILYLGTIFIIILVLRKNIKFRPFIALGLLITIFSFFTIIIVTTGYIHILNIKFESGLCCLDDYSSERHHYDSFVYDNFVRINYITDMILGSILYYYHLLIAIIEIWLLKKYTNCKINKKCYIVSIIFAVLFTISIIVFVIMDIKNGKFDSLDRVTRNYFYLFDALCIIGVYLPIALNVIKNIKLKKQITRVEQENQYLENILESKGE